LLQLLPGFVLAGESMVSDIRICFESVGYLAYGLFVSIHIEEQANLRVTLHATGQPVQVVNDDIERAWQAEGDAHQHEHEESGQRV
jgi:hypothetical protein